MPIFVPTAADLAALALLILAGALLMLAAWVVADWVMAMFDAMEGSDEAPPQPPPADSAQSAWGRIMGDDLVHRRPDRLR